MFNEDAEQKYSITEEFDIDIKGLEKVDIYTSMFYQHVPSFCEATMIVFFIFFLIGGTQGYHASIILILQSEGANMKDQSYLSLISYPYFFKMFFAPIMDKYYLKSYGKGKSYITLAGIAISIKLLIIGWYFEQMLKEKQMFYIVFAWFSLNLSIVFMQIAGEVWVLSLYDENQKAKGSLIVNTGQSVGVFVGYNIFIPFNSVSWLNENIFTVNKVDKPLIGHVSLLLSIALATIFVISYITFFTSERVPEEGKVPSLCQIIRVIPRFVIHRQMRFLLGYIFCIRAFYWLIAEPLGLNIITAGIDKTTIVNIDTINFPISLIASCVLLKYMKKGKIIQIAHIMAVIISTMCLGKYLILIDFRSSQNYKRTVVFLFISSFFESLTMMTSFLMGYYNIIADERIGSTFITGLNSFMNTAMDIPRTIGLRLIYSIGNFDYIAIISLILQTVVLYFYKSYTKFLDTLDQKDYNIVDGIGFMEINKIKTAVAITAIENNDDEKNDAEYGGSKNEKETSEDDLNETKKETIEFKNEDFDDIPL